MWSRGSRRRRLASVQEILPLEEISGDVVRLRGGDYRCVLEAQGIHFALKSEPEQEAILAGYRRFLNGLTYPLQVLVRLVPADVEGYLAGLGGARGARRRCGGSRSTTRRSCGASPASGRCSTAASTSSCRRKWTQHPGGPRRAGRAWRRGLRPGSSPRGNRATSPGRGARSPSAAARWRRASAHSG